MHGAEGQTVIFTNTLKHQNGQQNKPVNMASGNDLIKHNYLPYLYLTYVFWTRSVYN